MATKSQVHPIARWLHATRLLGDDSVLRLRAFRIPLWVSRLMMWSALLLWWFGARRLFDLHAPLELSLLLACFASGFVLCTALVLCAPRLEHRWFALVLGVAHGLCGLLVDVALGA